MYWKLLIFLTIFTSCMAPTDKGNVELSLDSSVVDRHAKNRAPVIESVSLINDQIKIVGSHFSSLSRVQVGSDSLKVISSDDENIILTAPSVVTLALNSAMSLFVETAHGASAVSVIFNVEDSSITEVKIADDAITSNKIKDGEVKASDLDSMGLNSGQVLQWTGTTWVGADLSGLKYIGSWDATQTGVGPDAGAGSTVGDYYIVDTDGTTDVDGITSWSVGDWVIWNGSTWDKIDNSTGVKTFNGRSGIVTAQTNDYTWNQIDKTTSEIGDIANVDTTGASAGKILKFDGTNWVIDDDLQGGGAGSVTSAEIQDGSIVNADINASAAIAKSKIDGLTTDLSNLASNIATNSTAISGKEGTISAGTTSQYWRGDKTWQTLDKNTIGLGNVLNLAQIPASDLDTSTSLGTSNTKVPSQNAVKSYVDTGLTGKVDTTRTINGQALSSNITLDSDDINEGTTNLYYTDARAKAAAVVNSTSGTESDQAPSVIAMKNYVTSQVGSAGDFMKDGSVAMTGNLDLGNNKINNASQLNITGDLGTNLTGTVSVSAGTTAVTGVGTAFLSEISEGDAIKIGTEIFSVTSVTDDSNLVIDSNHVAGASGITATKDSTILSLKSGDNQNYLMMLANGMLQIGDVGSNGGLRIPTNNALFTLRRSQSSSWPIDSAGLELAIQSGATRKFYFYNSSTGSVEFLVDGAVGIGTNAPTEELEVVGDVKATSFIGDGSNLTNISTAIDSSFSLNGDSTQTISMDRHTTSDTAGNSLNITAGGSTSGATNKNGGNLVLSSGTSTGTGTSAIEFKTTPAGSSGTSDNTPATAMTILGSGNVGIGTTSPQTKLEVNETQDGDTMLSVVNNDTTGTSSRSGVVLTNVGNGYNSDSGGLLLHGTSHSTEADELHLFTNSGVTNGLRLKTSAGPINLFAQGNIGIGTETPSAEVDIQTSSNYSDIELSANNGSMSGYLNIFDNSATNQGLTLSVNRREATGTHADINAASALINMQAQANKSFIAFSTSTTNNANPTERVRITETGRLGIGTSNPREVLDVGGAIVAGDANSTSGSMIIGGTYGNGYLTTFGTEYSSGAASIGYGVRPKNGGSGVVSSTGGASISRGELKIDNELIFSNAGSSTTAVGTDIGLTAHFKVAASGNVGIGTFNPTSKLDVNGTIKATDLNISGDITSDSDFYKTFSISTFAIDDFHEIAQADPFDAGVSGMWEIHVSGTRGNWTEGHTYLVATTHSQTDEWREAVQISENQYISAANTKCFTVDVNGSGNDPKFRLRAIKAIASCGSSGSMLMRVKIRAIGKNGGWTDLSGTGNDTTVAKYQPTGGTYNLLVGDVDDGSSSASSFTITTDGNVGIGNSTPNEKLVVNGNIVSDNMGLSLPSSNTLDDKTLPAGLYMANTATTGSATPGSSGAVLNMQSGVASGAVGQLQILANNTNYPKAYIRHSDNTGTFKPWYTLVTQDQNGFVGLGTDTPADHLTIVKDSATLRLESITPNLADTGSIVFAENGSADHFYIKYNGESTIPGDGGLIMGGIGAGDIMMINRNGQVGIGTNSPAADFHILNSSGGAGQVMSAFGGSTYMHFRRANGTEAAPSAVASGDNLLEFAAVGRGATTDITSSAAKIIMKAKDNWTDSTAPASMEFYTRDDNSVASSVLRMTIDKTGHVGIGEETPESILHIKDATPILTIGNTSTNQANAGEIFFKEDSAAGMKISYDGSADELKIIGRAGSVDTDLFTFERDGDLGIGTNAPRTTLDVGDAGNVAIFGDADLEDKYIAIRDTTQGLYMGLDVSLNGTNGAGLIQSGTAKGLAFVANTANFGGGTPHMYIDTAGSVGIGTETPSHLLHVNGVARSTSANFATSSDKRVKENVEEVEDGLEKIMALRPVRYNYVEEYTKIYPDLKGTKTGFIAQEVAEVDQTMVNYVEERVGDITIEDFNILNTDNMVPLLVAATQEQQRKIASLEEENKALKDEVSKVQSENKAIKEALCQINANLKICH